MDKSTRHMGHETEQPENNEDDSDCKEHAKASATVPYMRVSSAEKMRNVCTSPPAEGVRSTHFSSPEIKVSPRLYFAGEIK